jgi:hypothetical protein
MSHDLKCFMVGTKDEINPTFIKGGDNFKGFDTIAT